MNYNYSKLYRFKIYNKFITKSVIAVLIIINVSTLLNCLYDHYLSREKTELTGTVISRNDYVDTSLIGEKSEEKKSVFVLETDDGDKYTLSVFSGSEQVSYNTYTTTVITDFDQILPGDRISVSAYGYADSNQKTITSYNMIDKSNSSVEYTPVLENPIVYDESTGHSQVEGIIRFLDFDAASWDNIKTGFAVIEDQSGTRTPMFFDNLFYGNKVGDHVVVDIADIYDTKNNVFFVQTIED